MAKKKEKFANEDFFDKEEIMEEAKESAEKETEQKHEELGRLKVTSNRAYIFSRPDLTSRSVAAVNFGNLLMLLGESEEDFFKVRVPFSGESVVGFIRKTKVKRI